MSEEGRLFIHDQLAKMLNYAKDEYDLTYGEVIQVLETQKLTIFNDYLKSQEAKNAN